MFRRKNVTLAVVLFALISAAAAWAENVTVDEDELTSIDGSGINFINYVGPYEFINTVDQIRSIGRGLGIQIDTEKTGKAAVGTKYGVLHIVSPEIPEGLDADVFFLNADAAVDHIVNLRHIIAGYIETTYSISARDAYLLAEFITYYNAAYRGNTETVMQRYKPPVVQAVNKEKFGLDTHFSNWPGKTEMLIPLRSEAQKVDTGAITDEEVISLMRQEEGKGLESREDMVDLREKELDEEQKDLNKRQDTLEQQAKEIDEKLAKDEDNEDLLVAKAAIEEERSALEKEQEEIDIRTEEVMKMREDIAEDKNTALAKSDTKETFTSAEKVTPVWFLTVDSNKDGIPFGRVVKYNLENGKRLAVSKITAVRGRTMVLLPDALIVIAGKDDGNSMVRPMILDIDTLETRKEGSHNIFPGSLITSQGKDIYLVTTENGEWRLGKFNSGLERTAVSEIAVEPWTSVSFDRSTLYVQGVNGEILKLSASTLQVQARIEQ